jgi:hypothetical protein
MPRVGFESTILVFERASTVHALDRAAIAIGSQQSDRSLSVDLFTGSLTSLEIHNKFNYKTVENIFIACL